MCSRVSPRDGDGRIDTTVIFLVDSLPSDAKSCGDFRPAQSDAESSFHFSQLERVSVGSEGDDSTQTAPRVVPGFRGLCRVVVLHSVNLSCLIKISNISCVIMYG